MTIKIELLRDDALPLLRYLEQLNVLKVLLPEEKKEEKKSPTKSRFAGRISAETSAQLHQQLAKMREEWR